MRTGGELVATLRTTADGSVRFWPGLHGQAGVAEFELSAAGETATAAPDQEVTLTADRAGGRQGPVAVDVLFLLDATGSMGDEIDRLKTTIDSVAGRVAGLDGAPDARFGMTLYRDQDDAFVTSTYDLTDDLEAFRSALSLVQADGGGDYPEALDEGLADALAEPSWRDPAETVQLVFLVADAPPQVGRQVEQGYPASVVEAVGRGAKIFPIASSESDDQAEAVFRQVAAGTGSRFVFLSYGAGGAATGNEQRHHLDRLRGAVARRPGRAAGGGGARGAVRRGARAAAHLVTVAVHAAGPVGRPPPPPSSSGRALAGWGPCAS